MELKKWITSTQTCELAANKFKNLENWHLGHQTCKMFTRCPRNRFPKAFIWVTVRGMRGLGCYGILLLHAISGKEDVECCWLLVAKASWFTNLAKVQGRAYSRNIRNLKYWFLEQTWGTTEAFFFVIRRSTTYGLTLNASLLQFFSLHNPPMFIATTPSMRNFID